MKGTFARTVRLGVHSLLLHKLRSVLTTLGVTFGVLSVIAMLAIGEGAAKKSQDQFRALGSQNVIMRSVKPPDDVVSGGASTRISSYGLLDVDLLRARTTFPGVKRAVPVRQLQQEVRLGMRAFNPRVLATVPQYTEVTGRPLTEGRFLSEEDERRVSNVCVLGYEVARYLSPFESAVGKEIKIGADYFSCVGVLMPRVPIGSDQPVPGADVTGEVFIPLETGRKWFGDVQVKIRSGSREMEEVQLHEVILEVGDPTHVLLVASAARYMLESQHKQRDFEVVVPLELMRQAEESARTWTIVLGAIAAISLLVGGIGIMNVMLATVTERTREIGIRRALGAKKRHITTQFLVECVILSVGGGILGVGFGLLIPYFVERNYGLPAIIKATDPILAFGISALIGILFGLYPAWRAANMDPVEALRHE